MLTIIIHREGLIDLMTNNDESIKTMGMFWNRNHPVMIFVIKSLSRCMLKTQRTVLSIIARLFDPLGLLNPITIKAKKNPEATVA